MREPLKRHWPLLGILASYFLVIVCFPLKNQAIEPYAYAAAAEGYYDLSQTFGAATGNADLRDISRYHPNHPLPHYFASLFFGAFGVSALSLLKALNLFGALLSICFFYFLALRLLESRAVTVAATLLLVFSYAFWLSALSGETQMFSLALMTGALYSVVLYLAPPHSPRYLLAAATLYVLAGAFHLFSFVLIFPAGIAVLITRRGNHPWRLYLATAGIVLLGYAFFYGLLLVKILSVQGWAEYTGTLFIYRNILLRHYPFMEWAGLFYKTALRSWVYADGVWGFIPKAALIVLLFRGYAALARSTLSLPVKFLFIGWPLLQIGIQLLVYGRPEGINFWLFLFPAFFIAIAFALSNLAEILRTGMLSAGMVVLLMGVNFFTGIWPNNRLQVQDYAYLDKPDMNPETPVAIVVHEPVLTFPEIWTLGSGHNFRNQKIFLPCCGQKDTEQKLVLWLRQQSAFLLLTDENSDATLKLLDREKIPATRLQNREGEIAASGVPSSLYLDLPAGYKYRKALQVFSGKEVTQSR